MCVRNLPSLLYFLQPLGEVGLGAVGGIDAENIHAVPYQFGQRLDLFTRRANCSHYFGACAIDLETSSGHNKFFNLDNKTQTF